MKETFGEFIHALRIRHSLTLTKLAAALDIDQSTLSKIENNRRSVPECLIPKIASIFNLNIQSLLKEYYSEKIAEMIYLSDNHREVLDLVEDKIKHIKERKSIQGNINFK
ncbi:helix-turn-helix domain-containing protein [Pontibacter vulgaris]|uniref:helix-turn-helix domain-containing protein n=1 Tax=Pontibacter vulgaris TaxID=2905679 RepID=UPI001FA7CA8B|nr:helix-turn-helix transcriptional regulator [Pontibacter vulgaris]